MFKVNAYRLCFFSALFSINSTKGVYNAINSTDISQSEKIEQVENSFIPDIFQQTGNNDSTEPLFPLNNVMEQYLDWPNSSTHTFIPIGWNPNNSTDLFNINNGCTFTPDLILSDGEDTSMTTNNSAIPPAVSNRKNNNVQNEEKSTESDTSLARQQAFSQHAQKHNPDEEKPWQCRICNKSFPRKNALTIHIKRCSKVKDFKCDFCTKSFTTKFERTVHHRTHTGEKPFKCTLCNKSFATKTTLRTHSVIHNREKPFKCHICQKGLASKHSLESHINKHKNKKPFKCTQCNKTFSSTTALNNHIKKHNRPKPFVCQYCNAAFAHKKEYKDHIRYHEETDEDRKCHICKKVYADKRCLTKHNQRAHPKK